MSPPPSHQTQNLALEIPHPIKILKNFKFKTKGEGLQLNTEPHNLNEQIK